MSKSFAIKAEKAFAGHAQVAAFLVGRIDVGSLEITAIDEVMDSSSRDRQEGGDMSDFNERRNGIFLSCGTICNHGVEFTSIVIGDSKDSDGMCIRLGIIVNEMMVILLTL
jgi:hypothetical protein